RLFRTVFRRRLLARFPQDRFPPRTPVVPDAAATVRGVARPPEPLSPPPTCAGRMKGEVVFYRLFDLGASVDLDEIQGTVDMPFLAGRMLSERATPKYARFAAPLLVYVDQRTLETNLGSMVVSIAVTPVRVWTTAWRGEGTARRAIDPRPDAISDDEVAGTWRNWFSYGRDDLVVVAWDAALVIAPSPSYEDTLTVFELANLQLLALRT